jgi:hypothetical protein
MLGLTTLEAKLIALALVLAAIIAFTLYERHEGAAKVIARDNVAEISQARKDTINETDTVADLQKQVDSLSLTALPAPVMRLCVSTSDSVPSRSATASAESIPVSHGSADSSVQGRIEQGVNIGGVVQDIALAGMLAATDSSELWKLANEEAVK